MPVEGTTTIDNSVLARIAVMAAQEVDGVVSVGSPSVTRSIAETLGAARRGTAGVDVQVGRTEATFNLTLVVAQGVSIPDVARQVRERVAQRIEDISGLPVSRIDIFVADMQPAESRRAAQEEGKVQLPA